MTQAQNIWNDIEKIQKQNPVILNITNFVVTNSTANALLSLGAKPIMTPSMLEVEELVPISKGIVINIGRLNEPSVQLMYKARVAAEENNVPVVLDPVGSGTTQKRTSTSLNFLKEFKPTVVRGNATEILTLAEESGALRGKNNPQGEDENLNAIQALAKSFSCIVSISGATDIISDGQTTYRITNGHPLMGRVTGLGCTTTSLIGAFLAVNDSRMKSAAHAIALMGIAGEMAAKEAKGPGSLQLNIYDTLYSITASDLEEHLRLEISE